MALDEQLALKREGELLAGNSAARAAYEAYWGIVMVYAYGKGWANIQPTARAVGNRLSVLPAFIDPANPQRADIRVSMPFTRARVSKVQSRLTPSTIDFQVLAASGAMNDLIAGQISERRLDVFLRELRPSALNILGRVSLARVVGGSAILARDMRAGLRIASRDAAGSPVGQVPTIEHSWEYCPAYELARDASAYSPDFEGEDCIGREKPRSLRWLQRNFPDLPAVKELAQREESLPSMGQLLELQNFLRGAAGQLPDRGVGDSKLKGVMFGQWFHRDDEEDLQRRWPWMHFTFRDTAGTTTDERSLQTLWFDQNPYHNLPLTHFWYEEELNCPWGKGVAFLAKDGQDFANLAFTNLLRRLIVHGADKYLYIKDALEDRPDIALGNNPAKGVAIKREYWAQKPVERMQTPPLDQAMGLIISQTPDWMNALLNMAPVQYGQSAGREVGKTFFAKKDEADTIIKMVNDQDERQLNDVLTDALFDVVENEPVETLRELLSHDFNDGQLLTFKQQDLTKSIIGVRVTPGSLRPKTREEAIAESVAAINSKMVDPVSRRRTLLVQDRIGLDERERRAYEQQEREIASLLAGEEVLVPLGQDHATHMFRIELEQESPRWAGYSLDQQGALQMHWTQHEQQQMTRLQLSQPPTNPNATNPQPNNPQAMPQGQPADMGGGMDMTPAPDGAGAPGAMPAMTAAM